MTTTLKTMITKEEAYHICNKSQYGEASLSELMALNFRILYCKETRVYVKRNCKLTALLKSVDFHSMSEMQKHTLKNEFQIALQKFSH